MSRLRILVLGPDCDPEMVSIPFVSYCHAAALAQLHDVTLVVGAVARWIFPITGQALPSDRTQVAEDSCDPAISCGTMTTTEAPTLAQQSSISAPTDFIILGVRRLGKFILSRESR
jgi:hypothetical protein